jgi:prepilin-type processing-associated H-X9-DG protein
MNNGQQMIKALVLYSMDFSDYLPPNYDNSGDLADGHGWIVGDAGDTGAQQFNSDILMDEKKSLLASYIGKSVSIFKCPADTRHGKYQGTDPIKKNMDVPAARTFSMNQAVGTNPNVPGCKAAVDGPWLTGTHTYGLKKFYTYGNMSMFLRPGPSQTYVFVDEAPKSLNDGGFASVGPNNPFVYSMIDWPGTMHNNACGFAFADGHSEIKKWNDPRTTLAKNQEPTTQTQAGSADILWLGQHASALIGGK